MRKFIILFTTLCIASITFLDSKFFSPKEYNWKNIDVAAQEALTLAENGKNDKMLLVLDDIETQTKSSIEIDNNTKRLFSILINDVKTNTITSNDNLYTSVLKVRLLSDALYSNYDPLWLQYETHLEESVSELISLYEANDEVNYDITLNNFLNKYENIYASLLVDVDQDDLVRVDAKVNYLDFYRKSKDTNTMYETQLYSLQSDLDILFKNAKKDDSDPTFLWILFTTGGIIISTLTYVGWRKYRGEKEDKYKVKQSSEE
jgi:sporulation protein YpjB